MNIRTRFVRRPGAVLVLTVFCLIALLGFVALAIDLGMIAVARSQAQNAADAVAMAAARALTGDPGNDNNKQAAVDLVPKVAPFNSVLGQPIQASQVTADFGSYTYDDKAQKFQAYIPKDASDNWSLVKVRVNATTPAAFSRVFGMTALNVSAVATAAHRPRDAAVVLDFSGSMRFDSLLGIPYTGSRTKSNNPESVFPLFGHYSDTATAALQNPNVSTTISGILYGSANVTVDTPSGSAIVGDFYTANGGGKAFASADDNYATAPGGDNFLKITGDKGATYAKRIMNTTDGIISGTFTAGTTPKDANFEGNGYKFYTGKTFQDYVQGPRYWGKTFWVWPPNPTNDWRKNFFFKTDGVTPLDNHYISSTSSMYSSTGVWRVPRSSTQDNYRINYKAILAWLKSAPNPFPSQMQAGRIVYYTAIPDDIPTSPDPPTDLNRRFWKDYINYVLGLQQTGGSGASPVYELITPRTGYGADYSWGTPVIYAKPTGPVGNIPFMDYRDNPQRPKLHFWFGPMTMIDFLGNYNLGTVASPNWQKHWWWPGTAHESPLWQLKVGIQTALTDIKNNHPNDFVSVMYFSSPETSAGSPTIGRFNRTRSGMGRDYQRMNDMLWYPITTIDNPGTTITPYDYTNNKEAPRAMGATSPAMGFMLAYNQFSSNQTSLYKYTSPDGEAGGGGRKGSQKLVILETDGMANQQASASFMNLGSNNSYYQIRQPGEYPGTSGTVTSQIYSIVDTLVANQTASPPGYSTNLKPVLIHTLAFGTLFEPYSTDPDKATALDLLQNIQFKGKTQSNPATPLDDYKMITGTAQERIDKLQQAFLKIMQGGIQVSLIE